MHIPTCESREVRILPFDVALNECSLTNFDREKWIYVPDFYTEYRYVLGTVGENPLITVGINPSTAEPGNLDNTLKSVERIAAGNGFDSFIMFNVYAQRATDPGAMDKNFNVELHRENMKAFRWALERSKGTPTVWAAWGTIVTKRPYLAACLGDMIRIGEEYGASWCRVGRLSLKGHPHHPLYLKKDSKIEPFDVRGYVENAL